MATELAALQDGAGLASSIITFIEFSVKFGKLVRDIARTHGGLPRELEECREYIDVVAAWLGNIRQSIPDRTHAEEDRLLEQAIERCQNTAGRLMALLETLCGSARTDVKTSVGHRARIVLGDVKRAGKIMWRKEEITGIRDKLKGHRDDVHSHLGSRTGHHVKKVMDEQYQIGGSIRDLNEKLCRAVVRLDELELRQRYIIMQNHELIEKIDVLLGTTTRDRLNVFAVVFDHLPSKPLVKSTWEGMRAAAMFLLTPGPIMNYNWPPENLSNAMVQYCTRQLSVTDDSDETFTVQFIVSTRGRPLVKQPLLLQFEDKNTLRDFTITKALRKLKYPSERLPALRMTTKVMFVRLQQDDGGLSILDSGNMLSLTTLPMISDYYRKYIDTVLSSVQLFGCQPGAFDANKLQHISATNSEDIVNANTEPSKRRLESQWAIYIERDWSFTTKVLIQYCALAVFSRVMALLSSEYGPFTSLQQAFLFYLLLSISLHGYYQVLCLGEAYESPMDEWGFLVLHAILKSPMEKINLYWLWTLELLLLQWMLDNSVPELFDNISVLFPVLMLYFSVLTVVTKCADEVRLVLVDRTLTLANIIDDNEMRLFVLSLYSVILCPYVTLSIADRILRMWPTYRILAPLFGSLFAMVYFCHIAVVFLDGALMPQVLQFCYILAMIVMLCLNTTTVMRFMDEGSTVWMFFCLGNFISYCVTGLWIGRRWFQRRQREMYKKMKQSV